MKVLVACEFSGVVRSAFRARGHDAWSCDLLDAEDNGPHIRRDVRSVLADGWDMVIAHPPCTHLCSSGARWWAGKQTEQRAALDFVELLARAPVHKMALENPIGMLSRYAKPDQIIQPWQFGHGETKATCLWLKNLPLLVPTASVSGRVPKVHYVSPSPDRWKLRSRTYEGIAQAMAAQWG